MKRTVSLFICILLLTGIFVAGVSAEDRTYDKKYTFTVDIMNPDAVKADPRFEYIKDKFNVDFEFRPVNWSNWNEKVRIWTASSDMPDIMWLDFQRATYSEYVNWARQGAYKPLPELGGKYPNLQALRDKMTTDDYWEVDGKLYAWTMSLGSVEWRDPLVSTFSVLYRVDWAKKVGLYQEDGNYTWDEFVEMGKAFVEQDPGDNGKGNTIAFAGIGWSWPWFAGLRETHQLNDFDIKDGKYIWAPSQPEYLEGIKVIKRLYDDGILWEDQPIASNNAPRNKFIAGELGMYYTNVTPGGLYNDILKPMKQANPEIDIREDVEPMFVESPKGNFFAEEVSDYWSATLFSPKMSDEKLARWLEISNYMASEEGYRLSTIGLKDEDYKIKDDGSVELLWPKNEDGNYVSPYDPNAIRFFELTTLHDKFAYDDPTIPEEIRDDVSSIIRRHLQDDVYIRPYSYDTAWFAGDTYTRYANRLADTMDTIAEIVVSTNNMKELETEWKQYLKSKEFTVGKILKELNTELLDK